MSDAKQCYSDSSRGYVNHDAHSSVVDRDRYNKSKSREAKWNENWKKQSVNLNDIVEQFTPNVQGHRHGVKYVFENTKWRIDADMVAGYLRIYDKKAKKNVKLDGSFSTGPEDSHFKILKRKEM